PTTLSVKFLKKCRNVTPRPSAIAGRNICWPRLPGRLTTLTPTAMASAPLRPEYDQRRHHDVGNRDRQQTLPAEPQQLIRPEARQRPPDQELEHAERENLHGPPEEHNEHEQDVRQVLGQPIVDVRVPMPAAEE